MAISTEFIRPFVQGDYDTWKTNVNSIEGGIAQTLDASTHTDALGTHSNSGNYHNNNHSNNSPHSNYYYHSNNGGHSNTVPHTNNPHSNSGGHTNNHYNNNGGHNNSGGGHSNYSVYTPGSGHTNQTPGHTNYNYYNYYYGGTVHSNGHNNTHTNQADQGYWQHINGAGGTAHTNYGWSHTNQGHTNSTPHSNRDHSNYSGYHSNNHSNTSGLHNNHNNHSNSGHSNYIPHSNYTPHNNTGFDHTNYIPSKPYLYQLEENEKRLFGVVDLRMYSYDQNNFEQGTQLQTSKDVEYKIEVRKIKNLDGTANVSTWVVHRDFTKSEIYSFNTLDPLKTGNTVPATSAGIYEMRVTPKNPTRTENGLTKTYTGVAKTTQLKIEQNNKPTISVNNANEFISFTFGEGNALSNTGGLIDYSNLLFRDAPVDKTAGIFVSMNITDPDVNNYLKGKAYIKDATGNKISLDKDIVWENGSNSIKSGGTQHRGYIYVPKSEFLKGQYLSNAYVEVVLNDFIDDVASVGTGDTIIQKKVSVTDTRDMLVNIDHIVPNITLTPNTTAWSRTVTITASASDSSGIKNIKLPDGNTVSATSTTFAVSNDGVYSFEVTDKIGNKTTKTINITNIDNQGPSINIAPNIATPTNGNVSLTITGTDTESGVKRIQIPGGTWVTGTSTTYSATVNGTYTFIVEDNVGNQTTQSFVVTNIDKTAPNGTVTTSTTAWTNQDIVVTVNATDVGLGVKDITLPGGTKVAGNTATHTVSANGTYSFVITDEAGNTITKSITVSNIDKVAPTVSLSQNTNSWTAGNVTITVSGSDTASGVKQIKLPNGNIVTGVTSTTYSVSSNGTYNFEVMDNAGNITDKSITISNIDTASPIMTLTQSTTEWTKGNVTVTVNASDSQSGMYRIKLPNGTYVSGGSASYSIATNGTYIFEAYDSLNNKTTQTIVIENIDKTAPTVTLVTSTQLLIVNKLNILVNAIDNESGVKQIKLPNGTIVSDDNAVYEVTTNGTYSFEVMDNVGNVRVASINVTNIINVNTVSGLNRIEYKLEGATVKEWTTYTGIFNIANEGITTVKARAIDNAGNISDEATSFVKIDRSKPINGTVEIIIK